MWKHLSYRQFEDFFGDLGLTAWVKFNWLAEVPDGYDKVDLSTLNWIKSSSIDGAYFADIVPLNYKFSSDVKALCTKYEFVGTRTGTSGMASDPAQCTALYFVTGNPARQIFIKDTTIVFNVDKLKKATKNVWFIFEKA